MRSFKIFHDPDLRWLPRLRVLTLIAPFIFGVIFVITPIVHMLLLKSIDPDLKFIRYLVPVEMISLLITMALLYGMRIYIAIRLRNKGPILTLSRMKIMLFLAMCLFIPSFYFVFLGGGFLPLIVIYSMLLIGGAPVPVTLFYCIFYTDLYFLIAGVISNKIALIDNHYKRRGLILAIFGLSLFISSMPIYGIFGLRGGDTAENIIGVYKSILDSLIWRF